MPSLIMPRLCGWWFQGFEDAKIALIEGIVTGLFEKRPLRSSSRSRFWPRRVVGSEQAIAVQRRLARRRPRRPMPRMMSLSARERDRPLET